MKSRIRSIPYFPGRFRSRCGLCPVSDLIFVGKSTQQALHKLGIYTIGQLAATDVEILRHHLKKQGETIWEFANGRDSSLVESEPEGNKMYGNSTTVAFDITDEDTARMVLLSSLRNCSLQTPGGRAEGPDGFRVYPEYRDEDRISSKKSCLRLQTSQKKSMRLPASFLMNCGIRSPSDFWECRRENLFQLARDGR